MIIDVILDRRDGDEYTKQTLQDIYEYAMFFKFFDLARAINSGENKDIQRELKNYIDENKYNPQLKNYIDSVNWI